MIYLFETENYFKVASKLENVPEIPAYTIDCITYDDAKASQICDSVFTHFYGNEWNLKDCKYK